ncbi:MAG: GIY-YIG nuclease family protein [Candidatus Pacebacteria bacterium]|nr:GIY-YIG nuclease family protein [Candidatus Paceibacterota bacterium]
MFIVYVLQDDKGKFYKGFTNNLARRFSEHLRGDTLTTSKMKNLKIVYTEQYSTMKEARLREIYLKTSAGRRFLKKILQS